MIRAKQALFAVSLTALFACTSNPGTVIQKLDPRTPAGNATGTTASTKADVTGYWMAVPTPAEEAAFGKGAGWHVALRQAADGTLVGEENVRVLGGDGAIINGKNNGGTLTFTTSMGTTPPIVSTWTAMVSDDGATMSLSETYVDDGDRALTYNCTRLF